MEKIQRKKSKNGYLHKLLDTLYYIDIDDDSNNSSNNNNNNNSNNDNNDNNNNNNNNENHKIRPHLQTYSILEQKIENYLNNNNNNNKNNSNNNYDKDNKGGDRKDRIDKELERNFQKVIVNFTCLLRNKESVSILLEHFR